MKLTFANETLEAVSCRLESTSGSTVHTVTIPPGGSTSTIPPKTATSIRIEQDGSEKGEANATKLSNGLCATFPLKLGAKWNAVRVPPDSPWRIYRSKVRTSILSIQCMRGSIVPFLGSGVRVQDLCLSSTKPCDFLVPDARLCSPVVSSLTRSVSSPQLPLYGSELDDTFTGTHDTYDLSSA